MATAYVFPGQGAQFPGMAKPLYERSDAARKMLERANDILGFRITDLMCEGSEEDLRATHVTQPAIFLHSVVLARCSSLPRPDMVAGHSLGEFSALVAAGAMSFEDGLRLVSIRAAEMEKCCIAGPGTMAAVIGLPDEDVELVCGGCGGIVVAANHNCNGQIVISGEMPFIAAEKLAMLYRIRWDASRIRFAYVGLDLNSSRLVSLPLPRNRSVPSRMPSCHVM